MTIALIYDDRRGVNDSVAFYNAAGNETNPRYRMQTCKSYFNNVLTRDANNCNNQVTYFPDTFKSCKHLLEELISGGVASDLCKGTSEQMHLLCS